MKLDRTEPVPAAGNRLAHGDREVGLDSLLSRQGVDRLGEHEDNRLAHSDGDPRGGEDAGRDDAGRGRRRESPQTLGAEGGDPCRRGGTRRSASLRAHHYVVDHVGRARKKPAGRVPLVTGRAQGSLQLAAPRQDRHPHALEPGTARAKGDHRAQRLLGRPVRGRHGHLGEELVDGLGVGRRGRHVRGCRSRLGSRRCLGALAVAGRRGGGLPGRVLGRKAADNRNHEERRNHERATTKDQCAATPEPALARGTSPPGLTAHS